MGTRSGADNTSGPSDQIFNNNSNTSADLHPDMADPKTRRVASDKNTISSDVPPLEVADATSDRKHNVQVVADLLGKARQFVPKGTQVLAGEMDKPINHGGPPGPDFADKNKNILSALIDKELNVGGAARADSLAQEITAKLPDGMKLEIRRDAKQEEMIAAICKIEKIPLPDYIRVVDLKDQNGKLLGSFIATKRRTTSADFG